MIRHILALSVATSVMQAVCMGQVVERGRYEDGSYTVAGQSIRFFAFSFEGKLANDIVRTQIADFTGKLSAANRTAHRYSTPRSGLYHLEEFSTKPGDVFVFGFTNGQAAGWIAIAQRDRAAYPKFDSLSSNGKAQLLDANPGPNSATSRNFRMPDGSVVSLDLFVESGWVRWFHGDF